MNKSDIRLSTEEQRVESFLFDGRNYAKDGRKATEKQLRWLEDLAEKTKTSIPNPIEKLSMPLDMASKAIKYLQEKKKLYGHLLKEDTPATEKQKNFIEKVIGLDKALNLGVYDLDTISKREACEVISKYKEQQAINGIFPYRIWLES